MGDSGRPCSCSHVPVLIPNQEALPCGATILGVVLSSNKTNISIMSGNCMAHLLLISLANINMCICSKTSLHAYLLLALLPIAKFTHKMTCVRSLLQDRLVHQALNIVLSPLKTAATIGIMMSDPVGNLHYCFTPLAAWIADTPKESLLAATGLKSSPVTTVMSKNFGDTYQHPPHTATDTLTAIHDACLQCSLMDYMNFIKVIRKLGLNSIINPFWVDWLLLPLITSSLLSSYIISIIFPGTTTQSGISQLLVLPS